MRKLLGVICVLILSSGLSLGALGAPAQVCPEDGKVESVVDGDLDNIVLPAGTEVCIFGAATQVNVTADGESTLFELLGLDRNVSHYTITEVPPSTTTSTTTSIPTTTSSTPESTTSSTQPTTSTTMESTTTTETSVPATTTVPEDPSTTTPSTSPPTLPFTGPGDTKAWAGLGSLLLLGGLTTLAWSRRRDA